MTDTPTYWHGGPPIAGDTVHPSATTGHGSTPDHIAWVCITTNRDLAASYASHHPQPWLYEVEPHAPIHTRPRHAPTRRHVAPMPIGSHHPPVPRLQPRRSTTPRRGRMGTTPARHMTPVTFF
jgi:hypothetical protein